MEALRDEVRGRGGKSHTAVVRENGDVYGIGSISWTDCLHDSR